MGGVSGVDGEKNVFARRRGGAEKKGGNHLAGAASATHLVAYPSKRLRRGSRPARRARPIHTLLTLRASAPPREQTPYSFLLLGAIQ